MTDWLNGPGSNIVTIPDYIDCGAQLNPPTVRRSLCFGGAYQGITLPGVSPATMC
jgi:hypothetical protein